MKQIKSIILTMLTALLALPALAQVSIGLATGEDFELAGISWEKTEIPGGTVLVDNEAGTFSLAYSDLWGNAKGYSYYHNVKVGESSEIILGTGVVGDTNPTFESYQNGVMSAGAVFEIKAKKDGWMTVFTRLNPNKQYVVFEGKSGAVPYTLGVASDIDVINYSLPAGKDGYIDFKSTEASRYFITATKQITNEEGVKVWYDADGNMVVSDTKPENGKPAMKDIPGQYTPQFPYIVAGMSESPKEGTGFLTFRVRGGKTYYFSGLGTKMVCSGFVFAESEYEPSVTFKDAVEGLEIKFKTGLEVPTSTPPENEPIISGNATIVLGTTADFEHVGLSRDKLDMPGGTSILSSKVGSFGLAYDDQWGITSDHGYYNGAMVGNSDEIYLGVGAVGSTNPEFISYQEGVMSAGAVFEIKADKDGWMTVFSKINPGKQYLVFEGKSGAVPYTLGVAGTDYVINYSLPLGKNGYIDFENSDVSKYFVIATKQVTNENGVKLWYNSDGDIVVADTKPENGNPVLEEIPGQYKPQFPYLVAGMSSVPNDGTGFLTFKVFEGRTYYFSGLGTKMACGGFVFTDTEDEPTVTLFDQRRDYDDVRFKTGLTTPSATAGTDFKYNGLWYTVVNSERKTCKTKDAYYDSQQHTWIADNQCSGNIVIPEVATFGIEDFSVVEIGVSGFLGSHGLTSISLPSSIETVGKDAFEDCNRLTSLIWRGNQQMLAGVYDAIDNPNLLIYVDDAQYAPKGLDHNVVANGICQNLMLTPGYPFTPVSDFTAKSSSMTKEFTQTTGTDGCSGWETIVLPFDVTKVTSPQGHTLLPFNKVSDVNRQRPFWLYEADPTGEWIGADRIGAGVPYIISMPNNPRYNPAYNISGPVTFSNSNPQLITAETTAPYVSTWASGREFRSLWLPLDDSEKATAMGLNVGIANLTDEDSQVLPPGSAFHTGVLPKPLEAYVVSNDNAKAFKIWGSQSAVLTLPDEDGLKIAQEGRGVILTSSIDRTVDIYSADGTLLRRVDLKATDPVYIDGLPQGVCIILGRKIMIQ